MLDQSGADRSLRPKEGSGLPRTGALERRKEVSKKDETINITTAVAMYHAWTTLSKEFEKKGIGTEEEKAQRRSLLIPIVVLQVFGIEIALKALIMGQGGIPPRSHNLLELYETLAYETQKSIREKGEAMNIRVQGVMVEHRNSLQEWRYREDGKDLIVDPGMIGGTLLAVIQTYEEQYKTRAGRGEKKQVPTKPDPRMLAKAPEYDANVRIGKPERRSGPSA